MKQDFSCDYLADITGLVDNGENLYSCCHPSGIMCGKENCPVVIDFNRRCQKDAETSDYQTTVAENPSGTIDYKFCPMLTAGYISVPARPDTAEEMKKVLECHGPRCAWWDAEKERCAVLSLARRK